MLIILTISIINFGKQVKKIKLLNATNYKCIQVGPVFAKLIVLFGVQHKAPGSDIASKFKQLVARDNSQQA